MHDPYVVLIPGARGNTSSAYLVVHVDEWAQVVLKAKTAYTFANEHTDYAAANTDRDHLCDQGVPVTVYDLKET